MALDHRAAGVVLRGRVALDAAGVHDALVDPSRPDQPTLILSTCNRLELVWIGTEAMAAWWRARLGPEAAALLHGRRGRGAVRHLVRVAAGLESQLLGEAEILGQVRTAYALARTAASTDVRLELIVERALAGARRVRAESLLGTHAHSVSEAAVRLLGVRAGEALRGRTVLVVGAGEAARGALRALAAFQPARVLVVNRHEGRAAAAAALHGAADVRPWSSLAAAVGEADVIICATAARTPVITQALLDGSASSRQRWCADLAVPPNVDPALRGRADFDLLDLDDLRQLGCPEAASGSVALLAADALAEREVRRMAKVLRARVRADAIGTFHAMADEIAAAEVARLIAARGGVCSATESMELARLAERVARRVLFPVGRYLREGVVPVLPESPATTG